MQTLFLNEVEPQFCSYSLFLITLWLIDMLSHAITKALVTIKLEVFSWIRKKCIHSLHDAKFKYKIINFNRRVKDYYISFAPSLSGLRKKIKEKSSSEIKILSTEVTLKFKHCIYLCNMKDVLTYKIKTFRISDGGWNLTINSSMMIECGTNIQPHDTFTTIIMWFWVLIPYSIPIDE